MRCCFSLLLVVAVALPAAAEDWPRFRGPTGQGHSAETGLPLEWSAAAGVAWKTPIPGAGWSSPIVAGDAVFVTAAADEGRSLRLLRLDARTGRIVWDKEAVRQQPDNKNALNSYATSTPATDGERVYLLACDGALAAVDLDGNVKWTNRDFSYYSQHGLAVSPTLYGDLVIVPFDWSSRGPDKKVGWQTPWEESVILAVDKRTGEVRWRGRRGLSRIAHVTPLVVRVGDRDELVSGAGDVVQGFDPATGERLWSVRSEGEGVVPSVVAGEGLVFTTSGFVRPHIRAVRPGGRGECTDTHLAWQRDKDVPMIPSMLHVAPHLYAVTETGIVSCLKAATGEVVWRERLAGGPRITASPVHADGRIYLLSEKGQTTVLAAGPEFKVLATNALDEKCCAGMAVSGGRLFIRTEKHLVCIGPAATAK